MVTVEPLCFLRKQQFPENRRRIDGTERERFELEELSELCFLVRGDEQCVLDTHAKLPGEIDTGLIGNSHARHQWGWFPLHTELMRTFMYIQISSYAMTRAMQIIQTLAPQRLTGEDVNLGSAGSCGKLTEFYLDVSFQHKGIDPFLLLSERTEGDGAGDIRCAIEILCPTVEQQKTFRLQRNIDLWRCLIVNDGAVGLIASNRIEGKAAIEGLLGAKRFELIGGRDFGYSGNYVLSGISG